MEHKIDASELPTNESTTVEPVTVKEGPETNLSAKELSALMQKLGMGTGRTSKHNKARKLKTKAAIAHRKVIRGSKSAIKAAKNKGKESNKLPLELLTD